MLDMYGYVMEVLHNTPNDVERSVHVVPGGNPASAHSVADDEHNCEVWELYSGVLMLR